MAAVAGDSDRKALILRALRIVQDEEARQGAPTPQGMILRAMNVDPHDREAADQAMTLGGELVRITERVLGSRCWTVAIVDGVPQAPGPTLDPMTPGDPPQGTLFVMLLGMRLGREIGRLESRVAV